MTENRFFILKGDEEDDLPCIRDRTFDIKDIYGHYKYDDLEEICNELNKLHEENQERKRAMRIAEYYNKQLENENKELKKYLDSICK